MDEAAGRRPCSNDACRRRTPILGELLIIIALILASGVLAGAETAIIALRRGQLSELRERGGHAAAAIHSLRDNPERLLASVQIGTTVLSVTAAAFGGYRAADELSPYFARVPALAPYASPLAFATVIVVISYLAVVLGTLVPKSLGLRAAVGYAALLSRPLVIVSQVLRPIIWLLTASSNLLLRVFRDQTTFTESRLSPDELAQLVDEAARSGSVHPKAGEIAMRALDFGDVTIGEIMVPRTRVTAIPITATPEEIRRVLLEEAHAHFPVYSATLDDVVGIIATNDVLALAWEKELIVLQDLLRAPYFVPESMRAVDVLRELQRQRLHFAIVVDERGGTAGIVTIKDLLEELVGEIFGEHGREAPERIRSQGEGIFMVPGNMAVRDANRELPFELPEGEDWSTVGGLCIGLAGRIPTSGERFVTETGVAVEIVDASQRRVRWARVELVPKGPAGE